MPKTRGMLRREAAAWLVRLQSGTSADAEMRFRRWYEADPAHAAAFDRVSESYAKAGLLRQSDLARDGSRATAAKPVSKQPRLAIAAAVALVLLIPASLLVLRDNGIAPFAQREALLLVTQVGEIRPVTLADGSRVILDTDSRVEVRLTRSERKAELRQGRARFEAAGDPRPFVVEAGAATISSDGEAVFDVERMDDQSRVEVLSGSATVSGAAADDGVAVTRVGEGEALSAAGSRQSSTYRVPEQRVDWTHGMLQFDGTPLAEAIRQANRYSSRKIIVSGVAGDSRVTGAFRAGDTAGLARSLASAFDLELEQSPAGNFVLSPKRTPDGQKKK